MTSRDREWLRTFLHLNARVGASVPLRDVERQEDTVLRALALLDAQPGVVLADEVGMGKTYEALGVLAARLHGRPEAKALILTPGPDLNTKWYNELLAFGDRSRPMYRGFEGQFAEAENLRDLVDKAGSARVVIAPVSVFAGSRSQADLGYLISLWGHAREMTGQQMAAVFKHYREGDVASTRVSVEEAKFLGMFAWDRVKRRVRDVVRGHRASEGSLDALFEEKGYEAFDHHGSVDRALADLRFRLVGSLLPEIDLLVVDEAHKLKNPGSIRAAGVRTAFEGRFEKALFLTATPFQLTSEELSQVFALFALARTAPPDLLSGARRLLDDVEEYKGCYRELERVWAQADAVVAADFARWFEAHPDLAEEPSDPTLRVVVAHARKLLVLKRDRIEPGFRGWMIRSLREDKRSYRRSQRERLRPQGGAGVPFLLYERFIAELFRSKSRTHKAAVQINMVSSYGAAREGALLAEDVKEGLQEEAEAYRRLLQRVVGDLRDERGGHPKVEHVVEEAVAAAERDQKTLVFCTRRQSLREIKREIEAAWEDKLVERWRRVYPAATRDTVFERTVDGKEVDGIHSRLRDRFKRPQDLLYLALRERYAVTLLGAADLAEEHLDAIVERANEVLRRQRVPKTQAERVDWSLAKRCVEQATALLLRESGLAEDVDPEALEHLCDARYVPFGYDLIPDDVEVFSKGDSTPTWTIHADDARLVLRREHLWAYLTRAFVGIPAELRVRTVERLASYLVSRYVPFLPDLLVYAKSQGVDVDDLEARVLLPVVDRFWTTPLGRPWCDLLGRYLRYAGDLTEVRRREVLDDVVRADSIVRHTVDGETRDRLREAFNTPLYPMILVANEVMQEGLDLHHSCRRVVHHDLAWNPAQLEQRVGRVDRLGSLVQKEREKRPDTTLDIRMPLVANTIDERLERTVRQRERWLEFLLGAAPRLDEYGLADEPMEPLPPAFAQALRVELGPRTD